MLPLARRTSASVCSEETALHSKWKSTGGDSITAPAEACGPLRIAAPRLANMLRQMAETSPRKGGRGEPMVQSARSRFAHVAGRREGGD